MTVRFGQLRRVNFPEEGLKIPRATPAGEGYFWVSPECAGKRFVVLSPTQDSWTGRKKPGHKIRWENDEGIPSPFKNGIPGNDWIEVMSVLLEDVESIRE